MTISSSSHLAHWNAYRGATMHAVVDGLHFIPESRVRSFATEEEAISVFVAAQSCSILRTLP